MKSRSLFYICLSFMIVVSLAIVWRMFFYSPSSEKESSRSHKTSEPSAKNGEGSSKFSGMKMMESLESKGSIWSDPRLKEKQNGMTPEFSKNAKIQNDLDNLMRLYRMGSMEEFLSTLQGLIAANPQAPEFAALLADFHSNNHNWPQAEDSLKNLIKLVPENNLFQTKLGEVQAVRGDYPGALSTLTNVLQRDPANLPALLKVLSVSELGGNPEAGERQIEKLYDNDPKNGNLAIAKAEILMRQGRIPERAEIIKKALEQDSQNSELARYAANDAISQGNSSEGLRLGEIALKHSQNPTQKVESMKIIVNAAIAQKNLALAEKTQQQILDLRPDDAEARTNLEAIRKRL